LYWPSKRRLKLEYVNTFSKIGNKLEISVDVIDVMDFLTESSVCVYYLLLCECTWIGEIKSAQIPILGYRLLSVSLSYADQRPLLASLTPLHQLVFPRGFNQAGLTPLRFSGCAGESFCRPTYNWTRTLQT